MNWSNLALKGTMGAGSLCPAAILTDVLKPSIGLWGTIALIIAPFTILVMVKVGEEIPARIVMLLHTLAVAWYAVLMIASIVVMARRGFEPTDTMLAAVMALGFVPCIAIVRDILQGQYRD